jgi:hypothetical protein
MSAWGTDGKSLYPLFATPSSTLVKQARGKFWAAESYLITKQLLRIYLEAYDNVSATFSLNISVDTDSGVSQTTTVSSGGNIQFVNSMNQPIYFTNYLGQVINFTVPGVSILGQDFAAYGRFLGFSFTSTSTDFTIVAMSMLYKDYYFAG